MGVAVVLVACMLVAVAAKTKLNNMIHDFQHIDIDHDYVMEKHTKSRRSMGETVRTSKVDNY